MGSYRMGEHMAATKKSSSGSKKSTSRSTSAKKGGTRRRSRQQKQTDLFQSMALFALGLVLIVMLLLPGQAFWLAVRTALFGVLGVSFWLLGALCIYFAVLVARGEELLLPLAKALLGIITLSGAAVIFSRLEIEGYSGLELVRFFYENGRLEPLGGGVAGMVLGGLLLHFCGRPAANILVVIATVCALMIIFGLSPAEIWQIAAYYAGELRETQQKAGQAAAEGYQARRQQRLEAQARAQETRRRRQEEQAAAERAAAAEPEEDEAGPEEEEPGLLERAADAIRGLFGGRSARPARPEPAPARSAPEETQARVRDNHRSVMETALRNSSRAAIDIDLGDTPAAAPTGTSEPVEPVVIGPGGTFGMNPLEPRAGALSPPPLQEPDVILPETAAPPQPVTPQPAVTEILPSTPQGPGPARLQPEPPPPQQDSDWISITAQPPAGPENDIDVLTAAAMDKPARAESAAAAAPLPAAPRPAAYSRPPLDLFEAQNDEQDPDARAELKANAEKLISTLESFGVKTRILDISRGPSVTRYEVQPLAGVKISRITSLADDIALNLSVADVRIEAPIPGKPAVGIEVPNRRSTSVGIRSIFESPNYSHMASPLTIALGKDIAGVAQVTDLCKMPHLLIAGSTGSGKSVCVNSIIISFLYRSSPEEVKLILIDPKVVELAEYNGIPHLLMPVVTEPRKAAGALCSAVGEMERRYHLFAEHNVRDIKTYNKLAEREGLEKLPYIAIVIDELADLMMVAGKEVEDSICRIAQKARAAGMHLIVATQRPSVDVITGLIKANIPSRIAFAVSSQVDSRTILDGAGAEKLLGMGDMLFLPVGASKPIRIQGTYVKDEEISRVLDFVKNGREAEYNEAMIAAMDRAVAAEGKGGGDDAGADDTDPMFGQCVECVIDAGQASTSLLQRRCKLGYARAARIMDEMEQKGIIGPYEGAKPRAVLVSRQQWKEMSLNRPDGAV